MVTRKKYSKEFKLDAISLVIDQNYSRREAASNLGINDNLLGRWVKEHRADDDRQAFRWNGKLSPEQVEMRQLKEENRRPTMEKGILRKATVFFAGETN